MEFMIIATVDNVNYMTKITADSALAAEHSVLDKGVCGKHTYGVTSCQAFDVEMMNTDCFRYTAIKSEVVSFSELCDIIAMRNEEIILEDTAEDIIKSNEKKIRELQEQIEDAKKILVKRGANNAN